VLPQKPLRQWVLSLPFALRFLLATDADALTRVLGIVYRAISGFILCKAKLTRAEGDTGSVTLIHLHMLVLDGAFLSGTAPPVFRRVAAPTERELQALVERIAERIGHALERDGLMSRDCENTYLNFDPAEGAPLNDVIGHSITYRVAVGPRTGQKVFTLRSLSAQRDDDGRWGVAVYAGFSLHAVIGIAAVARSKLERLCRYVSRPAIAAERLSLTPQRDVHYCLKTPYRDGTTHIVLEPLDFIARLAALVPSPRAHQTRYHGVFAPGGALRAAVTPSGRGRGARAKSTEKERAPRAAGMNWMQRLKRAFAIDIEACQRCGGTLEVIASIEDPELIERIFAHRKERAAEDVRSTPFAPRAPPQPLLL
jgi:hypothetical protein